MKTFLAANPSRQSRPPGPATRPDGSTETGLVTRVRGEPLTRQLLTFGELLRGRGSLYYSQTVPSLSRSIM